jgi:predicted glycosyltransferase
MNENYVPDEVAKEFEEYYGKTRGITIAAFGVDMTAHMEMAAKVAFFAGYGCGLLKAERTLIRGDKK